MLCACLERDRPDPSGREGGALGRRTSDLYNTGWMGLEQMANSFCVTVSMGRLMRTGLFGAALVIGGLLAGCTRPGWREQLQSEDPLRRIEGAIAAGRTRERAAMPLLVDRLEDDDVAVRMYAIIALTRIEGTSLGYKPWADAADRVHMAQRWRDYLKDKHRADLAAAQPPRPDPVDTDPACPATAPSSQTHPVGGPQ